MRKNFYNLDRFSIFCNFVVYQDKYLKENFPNKSEVVPVNFLNIHYIMQNIFFEYSNHFSLVNIDKNITMQKKDT